MEIYSWAFQDIFHPLLSSKFLVQIMIRMEVFQLLKQIIYIQMTNNQFSFHKALCLLFHYLIK